MSRGEVVQRVVSKHNLNVPGHRAHPKPQVPACTTGVTGGEIHISHHESECGGAHSTVLMVVKSGRARFVDAC